MLTDLPKFPIRSLSTVCLLTFLAATGPSQIREGLALQAQEKSLAELIADLAVDTTPWNAETALQELVEATYQEMYRALGEKRALQGYRKEYEQVLGSGLPGDVVQELSWVSLAR